MVNIFWHLLYYGFFFFIIFINFLFFLLRKKGFKIPNHKKSIIILNTANVFFLILYFISQNNIKSESIPLNIFISLILIGIILSFTSLILSSFYPVNSKIIDLPIPARKDSKKGKIKIGRLVRKRRKKFNFYLTKKDLERHVFICGFTGTGKSNFVQNFLINFKKRENIPFLLVEFKGEYKFLCKRLKNILLLSPGENFSINIFNPEFINPSIHAERIFEILKSSQFLGSNVEYTPQMEKVLIDIMINVCNKENARNWQGFHNFCEKYLLKYENQIPQLKQTIISIKNRIRRFSEGPLKKVFENNTSISIKEILQRDCILDLSSIIRLGGDKEDIFFFLNVILKYLWDYNLESGGYQGIKHITIIEDAQYFVPKSIVKKSKLSTYLEDIALLQRGTGECLICIATRLDISEEILANSGIVVSFKNYYEKEILGELLSLPKDHYDYLSYLNEGQCIVRVNSIKDPFVLQIPFMAEKKRKLEPKLENYNSILLKKPIKTLKKVYNSRKQGLKFKLIDFKNSFGKNKKDDLKLFNGNNKNLVEFKKDTEDKFPNNAEKNIMKKFYEKKKITIKNLKERIKNAQKYYLSKSFEYCGLECKNIIEELLEQIACRLNYKFSNINDFLENIEKNQLKKSFIIYSELKKLSKIVEISDSTGEISAEDANLLLKYTKRVFLKLNNLEKKFNGKNGKFQNAYEYNFKELIEDIDSNELINVEMKGETDKKKIPNYKLLLSIFDITKGPIRFLKISNLELSDKLQSIIFSSFYDNVESKILVQEGYNIYNQLFQISSKWNREFKENILLSLIFKDTEISKEIDDTNIFNILNASINEIKNNKMIFKGFYFQKRTNYYSKLSVNQKEILKNYKILKKIFIKLNRKIKSYFISFKNFEFSLKKEQDFELLKQLIENLIDPKKENNLTNKKIVSENTIF